MMFPWMFREIRSLASALADAADSWRLGTTGLSCTT
jgi:hypothetical protein